MLTAQEYLDIYQLVGVAIEVYNTLGRGLSEALYQEAFALEMNLQGMDAEREKQLRLSYKGIMLDKSYYADFYYKGVVVELKAIEEIASEHRAQLFNYMRIAQQDRGILFNFGEKSLRTERYFFDKEKDRFVLLTQKNYKNYIME
jgi:GxxExxY protein